MMKYLLAVLFFINFVAKAQDKLLFNQKLIACEDKWIALPMAKDSTFTYGFVYLDNAAGLTFDMGGKLKMTPEGKLVAENLRSTAIRKTRISPTNLKVAVIPEMMFDLLKVEKEPTWLKNYKTDTNSIQRLFKLGFTYNEWNECKQALQYLDRVKKINPGYEGLIFEYAFAYNALKEYDKAEVILKEALFKHPGDCLLNKELIFAKIHQDKIVEAAALTKEALKICFDQTTKIELYRNMLATYVEKKDNTNFKIWNEEAQKAFSDDSKLLQLWTKMEEEINK